jgi:hypothetical protein
MSTDDTRYLDNRSPTEIMEERLNILTQELTTLKSTIDNNIVTQLNKTKGTMNDISEMISMVEKKFEEKMKEREAAIYSSLYNFRVFRWKIEGSVGNVPYIHLHNFSIVLEDNSNMTYPSFTMSYIDLLDFEKSIELQHQKIDIPLPNPTILIRFAHPVKHKTWHYISPHIPNQGYNETGQPSKWIIEGSNDEKNWTLLSEGNSSSRSILKNQNKVIYIRSYKR